MRHILKKRSVRFFIISVFVFWPLTASMQGLGQNNIQSPPTVNRQQTGGASQTPATALPTQQPTITAPAPGSKASQTGSPNDIKTQGSPPGRTGSTSLPSAATNFFVPDTSGGALNQPVNQTEPQKGFWHDLEDLFWKLVDTLIGIILGLIGGTVLGLTGLLAILFGLLFGLLWWLFRKGWITKALEWYESHPFWALLVAFLLLILAAILIFTLPEDALIGLVIFVLLIVMVLLLGSLFLILIALWKFLFEPLWHALTKAWRQLKGWCKKWFPIAEMACKQWDEHMEKVCDEWEKIFQCEEYEKKWHCDEYEQNWICDEYETEWQCSEWHWALRWLCLFGAWVSTGVCKLGRWVATNICKLGKWIDTGLCLIGKWVATGLCRLFHWVTTRVCRAWVRVIRWVAE